MDNLQAMLNLVVRAPPQLDLPRAHLPQLISSGRFIKAHGTPDASRMQYTLKRTVNAASERFHDSLDELENEIRQAQAVLRRDLARLQAERRQREAAAREKEAAKEKAAEQEKARLAAESSAKQSLPAPKHEASPEETAAIKPERLPSSQPAEPSPEPSALHRDVDDTQAPDAAAAPKLEAGQDTTMENAGMGDMEDTDLVDFDALFGDSGMDVTDDAPADINLDPPDLSFSLEDFAKSGEDDAAANTGQAPTSTAMDLDFTMPDLSDMTSTAPPPAEQPSTNDSAAQPPAAVADDDDLNLDTMTTDNLDDLFNFEEPSQFDDAILGWGES